ncbi:MAG: carboxylesterase family protein, partial [Planctomycetaceae bacterium]|nr:carboxylesterase family protein [Planctomycetaceae bacterium]
YVMASHTMAERRAALNAAPVYLYYLAWETPISGGRMMSPHSLDIPFMFDNTRINRFTAGSETAIALADKVSDTMIHFARTGDPNVGKLPVWLPYDAQNRHTMILNNVSALESDPLQSRREIMQPILKL